MQLPHHASGIQTQQCIRTEKVKLYMLLLQVELLLSVVAYKSQATIKKSQSQLFLTSDDAGDALPQGPSKRWVRWPQPWRSCASEVEKRVAVWVWWCNCLFSTHVHEWTKSHEQLRHGMCKSVFRVFMTRVGIWNTGIQTRHKCVTWFWRVVSRVGQICMSVRDFMWPAARAKWPLIRCIWAWVFQVNKFSISLT